MTEQASVVETHNQAFVEVGQLADLRTELETLNEDAEYLPAYRVGNKVAKLLARYVGGEINNVIAKMHQTAPKRNSKTGRDVGTE